MMIIIIINNLLLSVQYGEEANFMCCASFQHPVLLNQSCEIMTKESGFIDCWHTVIISFSHSLTEMP